VSGLVSGLRVQLGDEDRRQFWAFNPAQGTSCRLFCFPYGGGGASVYQPWARKFVSTIQLCPIQLPGRENRHTESPITQFHLLISTLVEVLKPLLDVPFAFYGHSLGALSAFETTRELTRRGMPNPTQLFISGCRAPQLTQAPPMRSTSDDDFLTAVEQLYGELPSAIRSDPEMLPFFLRVLRADFDLLESYRYVPEEPLAIPMHVFGGMDDTHVQESQLEAWRIHAADQFSLRMYAGDHFFIRREAQGQFLQDLNRFLESAPHALPAPEQSGGI
jgi:medium-chain acyl-[acyl-carrier-protein] hydrolase